VITCLLAKAFPGHRLGPPPKGLNAVCEASPLFLRKRVELKKWHHEWIARLEDLALEGGFSFNVPDCVGSDVKSEDFVEGRFKQGTLLGDIMPIHDAVMEARHDFGKDLGLQLRIPQNVA
jgi:hypothetical protein